MARLNAYFFVGIVVLGMAFFSYAERKNYEIKDLLLKKNSYLKAPRPGSSNIAGPLVGCNVGNLMDLIQQGQQTTDCCDEIRADFQGTFSAIAALSSPCAAIPIREPMTIEESGYYCLAQDIEGQIIIDANNVVLDLNNHRVTTNSAGDAIQVAPGINRIIKNGIIANASWGIVLDGNTTTEVSNMVFSFCDVGGVLVVNGGNIILENLDIEFSLFGVLFASVNNACSLKNIIASQSQQGFVFEFLNNSVISDCHVFDGESVSSPVIGGSNYGFGLLSGENNIFQNCSVQRYNAFEIGSAFVIDDAKNTLLKNCTAQNITSIFPPDSGIAAGFLCTSSSNKVELIDCSVSGVHGILGTFGYILFGDDIVVDHCISLSAFAFDPSQGSAGFFCDGTSIALTNCSAHSSFEGFTITSPASLQRCQGLYNNIGFNILAPTSLVGNCVAYGNSIGFNAPSSGFIHNCFAAQNLVNNYVGVPNVQNANAQVDTSIVGLSGPIAGGNLFMP